MTVIGSFEKCPMDRSRASGVNASHGQNYRSIADAVEFLVFIFCPVTSAKRASKMEANETVWHKCRTPFFPRRTADGKWTFWHGQTWRRRTARGWEYRQEEETDQEYWE